MAVAGTELLASLIGCPGQVWEHGDACAQVEE